MTTSNTAQSDKATAAATVAANVSRRRELLKGLGKGSVLMMASAVPLKTLASQSTCTHPGKNGAPVIRCGISGMQSGIGSRETFTVCEGYSPGWWGQEDNGAPRRAWPTDYTEDYALKFGKVSLAQINYKNPTLFQVMSNSNYSDTDTRHWICAWLNALSGGPKGNFPYTGIEVLQFYNGTGKYTPEAALTFFKTYMETHTG